MRRSVLLAVLALAAVPAAASAGTLRGTVTSAGDGHPLESIHVYTYPGNGYALTAADGTYAINGLNGTYKVQVYTGRDHLSEWYDDSPTSAGADPVTIGATDTVIANAALTLGGSITGHVQDKQGNPVVGIDVHLFPGIKSATTNVNGNYRLEGLPADSYRVSWGNNEFVSQTVEPVVVELGQTTRGVNATLARYGSIAGTVRNGDGGPVAGADVEAVDDAGQRVGDFTGTAADGSYRLTRVLAGTYRVRVRYDNVSPVLTSAVTVGDGQARTGIDAVLNPETGIVGRVLGQGGVWLPGYPAIHVYRDGERILTEDLPESGSYNIPLDPGVYRVRFYTDWIDRHDNTFVSQFYDDAFFLEDATPVTVTKYQLTTVNQTLPQEAVLQGRVTLPGGTGATANVVVFDAQGRVVGDGRTTNSQGDWTVKRLPAGPLRLLFTSSEAYPFGRPGFVEDEYYRDKSSLAAANVVTVVEGQIRTGLNAELRQSGSIAGVVTGQGDGPVEGKAYLTGPDGRRAGPFTIDASGHYLAYGLRPGNWTATFAPKYSTYLSKKVGPVTVYAGQTARLDATLDRSGRITGLVTDESRGSIPGVTVSAYNGFDQVVGSATTAANGQYVIRGLPTNVYRVRFQPPSGSGFAGEFYDDKSSLASADGTWVMAGSTVAAIDAELGPP